MEYAPEAITQSAQQVTQVFKAALEQRLASSPTAATIADVEREMRELLRQMGAQALSQFLSLGAGTPVPELPCACGGTLHYQRQREATPHRGPWIEEPCGGFCFHHPAMTNYLI